MYYKMLIGWTSQKIKDSYTVHNPFDFKHGNVLEKASQSTMCKMNIKSIQSSKNSKCLVQPLKEDLHFNLWH